MTGTETGSFKKERKKNSKSSKWMRKKWPKRNYGVFDGIIALGSQSHGPLTGRDVCALRLGFRHFSSNFPRNVFLKMVNPLSLLARTVWKLLCAFFRSTIERFLVVSIQFFWTENERSEALKNLTNIDFTTSVRKCLHWISWKCCFDCNLLIKARWDEMSGREKTRQKLDRKNGHEGHVNGNLKNSSNANRP